MLFFRQCRLLRIEEEVEEDTKNVVRLDLDYSLRLLIVDILQPKENF